MNGMPVRPSRPITASGLSTSLLPPNANWTSVHCTPASAHAARTDSAAMSMADLPAKRPNGCSPTPMIATSSMSRSPLDSHGLERVGDDLRAVVVGPERHDHELDLHAELEHGRVALGQAGLDPDLVAELHEPDAVGPEGLGRLAAGVGLLGQEVLGGPRPQRPPPGQQVAVETGGAAPPARGGVWGGGGGATRAPGAPPLGG